MNGPQYTIRYGISGQGRQIKGAEIRPFPFVQLMGSLASKYCIMACASCLENSIGKSRRHLPSSLAGYYKI